MKNLRVHGKAPCDVAVIHGGPGAPGGMEPVAREISRYHGTLEPLQAAASVEGQLQELKAVLAGHASLPVTLIGHSWGAWLSLMFAAKNPAFVKKLILIGSGPLEEKYASKILETRLLRLDAEERSEIQALMNAIANPSTGAPDEVFARFGELMSRADSYDPLPQDAGKMQFQYDIFRSVWDEAEELRRSGELLTIAGQVRCPVIAIHGDYDPHPFEGVEKPLRRALMNFRSVLLKDCGHEPWMERKARDQFFDIIKRELD